MKRARDARPSSGLAVVGVLLLVAAAGLGFLVGHLVRSPAEVLAETAAPPRTVLTEPVRTERVTRTVAFDAQVVPRYSSDVSAGAMVGTQRSVVTRLPARTGAKVRGGALVAEVSGAPVFVLEGRIPAYRTLHPGMTGPDVRQLQLGLAKAGFPVRDPPGVYGPTTSAGVEALYRSRGYEPTRVGGETVAAAASAVRSAERSLARLRLSHASALDIGFAADDLSRARRSLASARAKSGVELGLGQVVYVPTLPARVASVDVSVGSAGTGTLLTLTSGPLVVRGTPSAVDAAAIRRGDKVRLLLTPSGEALGMVTGSAHVQQQDGDQGPPGSTDPSAGDVVFAVAPTRRLPPASAGSPVRAIVMVASSARAGLTVPLSAVSGSANGDDTVTVIASGRQRLVRVMTGFSGDGLVQVTPIEGRLQEGDQVVVGVGSGS